MTFFSHLACSQCGNTFSKDQIQTYCPTCVKPLLACYALQPLDKAVLRDRPKTMWRYREVLPVSAEASRISLGEGFTPLMQAPRLGAQIGLVNLWIKDEGLNPTGSFKARGLGMAVSKAHEFGISRITIPTAGNAGSALAAYGAKAGMDVRVYMPVATPKVFQMDCEYMGATVKRIEGSIRDCGAAQAKDHADGAWFDLSTLKEPYRIEGKKTMGYEIAEQLDWQTPDVILYPTGGGTGLIGIWKAFKEMLELGWIDAIKTRMVAVQVAGCAPIVPAFEAHETAGRPVAAPEETIANGLRVPAPFGDRLILQTLYESQGTAVAVTDAEMIQATREIAQSEGVFVAPEGAAVWEACKKLTASGWIQPHETVVLLNTGSAYKYLENLPL